MAEIRVNPTRMEMKKLQGRLATARKGHKLLKDKCDELMKQFLDLVRENKTLREKVESDITGVHAGFSVASAVTSPKLLEEALMLPRRSGNLDVSQKNMMSVSVPVFSFDIRESGGAAVNYGFAFTSGELDDAVAKLSDMLPDLIKLAELEKSAQLLADEIERTRRRVNALEYIMIPQYESAIKGIKMKLDENERSSTTRLMKVKDMTLQKEIEQRRRAALAETNS